jgi:hypothetical protein
MILNGLQGITSQKTEYLINTAVRNSNPTQKLMFVDLCGGNISHPA